MFKKISEMFDLRTNNKYLNVLISGIISIIIAWSVSVLFYGTAKTTFTFIMFSVLWAPLVVLELRGKNKEKDVDGDNQHREE